MSLFYILTLQQKIFIVFEERIANVHKVHACGSFLVLMARMECLEEYFLFIYNHFYGGTLC